MNKNIFMALMSLFLVDCVADSTGLGPNGGVSSSSSSGGESTVVGDAFPPGAVALFRKTTCPDDWDFFPEGHGRAFIAANDGLPRGTLIGDPLEKGEDREHSHALNTTVEVPVTEIAGIEGGGNGGMTPAGTYPFAVVSSPARSGVPYVRFLACKKREMPAANALPLPSMLQSYFDLDVCPSGWKKVTLSEGRLVVGLPTNAPADLPFGGKSITTPEAPTHNHTFTSSFYTDPHGVALASGCCGKFGKNGQLDVMGETDSVVADMPMIALLQCEKE